MILSSVTLGGGVVKCIIDHSLGVSELGSQLTGPMSVVFVCAHVWKSQVDDIEHLPQPFFVIPPPFQLDLLASEHQGSVCPLLAPPALGCVCCYTQLSVGTGDPNSGPLACAVSTSLTELSLQSLCGL